MFRGAFSHFMPGSDRDRSDREPSPVRLSDILYRDIFEKYYPSQSQMIADFWMPNKSWEGCDVSDPSARVMGNYGASGE